MIPKVIHFCWLSGDPYPAPIKKCMKTWKKVMPGLSMQTMEPGEFRPRFRPAIRARRGKSTQMGVRR